jgi:hypothetical protein
MPALGLILRPGDRHLPFPPSRQAPVPSHCKHVFAQTHSPPRALHFAFLLPLRTLPAALVLPLHTRHSS